MDTVTKVLVTLYGIWLLSILLFGVPKGDFGTAYVMIPILGPLAALVILWALLPVAWLADKIGARLHRR